MSDAVDQLFLDFQTAVAGRYSLERELGRGGMGIVYLAREVSLDRLVAIKLLPPTLAAVGDLRDRFLREARTAAQLSQPNIVPILTVDQAGAFVYFVMAYVDGETLGERVRSRGPLPAADATRILRELAWALAYAHAQGVIHRDIKADNIILEAATGRAVLTDFGIARRVETTGRTTGELIGTPEYMSPEQVQARPLDGRADLYALGVVGFYAVTGRLPFEGETVAEVLAQQVSLVAPAMAPLAPGAPRGLTQAVMKCLEKDPADRYADAKGVADALSEAIEARRETPALVRAFIKDSLEISGTGCLYAAVVGYLGPSLLSLLVFRVLALAPAMALQLYAVYFLFTLVVVPMAFRVVRTRRLLKAGYGLEDVLTGIRAETSRRTEELHANAGREPSGFERFALAIRLPGLVAGFTGLVGILGMSLGIVPVHLIGTIGPLAGGGFLGWITGHLVAQRRQDILGQRRLKFWGGSVGRWIFSLASRGLPPRIAAGGATHRPTELAIAFAAEDLFNELPKATRAVLRGLPEVIRSLERQARAVRVRIEGLEQSLADLRRGPGGDAARGQRDVLESELTEARDLARVRLGEAVAALETIRLDLLRLRAGAGTVDRVTADLTQAREIGEAVDRLLEGNAEVERALRNPEGTPPGS